MWIFLSVAISKIRRLKMAAIVMNVEFGTIHTILDKILWLVCTFFAQIQNSLEHYVNCNILIVKMYKKRLL